MEKINTDCDHALHVLVNETEENEDNDRWDDYYRECSERRKPMRQMSAFLLPLAATRGRGRKEADAQYPEKKSTLLIRNL